MDKILLPVGVALTVSALTPTWATTWYVDGSVAQSGGGTTWGTAFKTIQEGIDATAGGDEVIVAEGTYDENIHFKGKNIVLRSTDPLDWAVVERTVIDGYALGSVVKFAGTEDESCVLSGFTITGGVAPKGGGINGKQTHAGIQNNAITRNWCVTSYSGGERSGGGLFDCDGIIENNVITRNAVINGRGGGLADCDGTIRNNTIAGNWTDGSGGADGGGLSYCIGVIQNNVINRNSAPEDGGGLYQCHGTIQDNTIIGNSAGGGGGLSDCSGDIGDNVIAGNAALNRHGGGLWACDGTIQNNIISGNSAHEGGGGLSDCDGVIRSNIVSGNESAKGGGLFGCQPVIQNNLIAGNAAGRGGGLYMCIGIQSNTIYGNYGNGGAMYECPWPISNCIIWANGPSTSGSQFSLVGDLTYCCIEGWTEGGEGNISDDPLFVGVPPVGGRLTAEPTFDRENSQTILVDDNASWNPGALAGLLFAPKLNYALQLVVASNSETTITVWGDLTKFSQSWSVGDTYEIYDYRLSPDSPCIDAGKNGDWMADAVDLDGNSRIADGNLDGQAVADMGAYEHMAVPAWYVDGSVSQSGDGTTMETAFQTIQEGIAAASDGDAVMVAQGIYTENVQFDGKNIIVRSTDPFDRALVESTVIDGSMAGPVITFAGTEDETCVLSGFTIRNGSGTNGGGILGGMEANHTHAAIQNCIITGNSASGDGGGAAFCDGVIENCIIVDNLASGSGGGLYDCDGMIRNNLVLGNDGWNGGGFYVCDGLIQNNTLSGNSAGRGGGMSTCAGTVTNCILWGNTAQYRGPEYDFYTMDVSYCCVSGYAPGEGNIDEYPRFVDPDGADDDPSTYEDNDYHVWVGSPCIDVGKNEGWMAEARDLDGNPRLLLGRVSATVDMGAYEFVFHGPTAEMWYVDESVSASGDGKTLETAFKTIQEAIDATSDAGDTVIVAEGTYGDTIDFRGKNIALRSTDPTDWSVVEDTIMDGNQGGSVVTFAGTEDETCVLSGFTIRNGSGADGGGILGGVEASHTHASIQNCIITGNSASGNGGGAVFCDGVIENCIIVDNLASGSGGGLHDCDGIIRNNLVVGNSASGNGGGFGYCDGVIQNNTLCGNSAGRGGGMSTCTGTVTNCILCGNTAQYRGPEYDHYTMDVAYCCVNQWAPGEGNINDDPLFVDPDGADDDLSTYEDNDYRLDDVSPCIDKGKNEEWMGDAVDLDGNPRIWPKDSSGIVEMGAYENGSFHFEVVRFRPPSVGGGFEFTWISRPGDSYTVWSSDGLSVWTQREVVPSQGQLTTWTAPEPDPLSTRKFYRFGIR